MERFCDGKNLDQSGRFKMTWLLVKDGKVLSSRRCKVDIQTEAVERELVIDWSAEFGKKVLTLTHGVEIKKLDCRV
jgi:hypothetical protein